VRISWLCELVFVGVAVESFFTVVIGLVLAWYGLKGLYYVALAVWEEIGPAVRVLWRVVAWLVYLPFAPFAALWEVIFGRPETEEEREQRLQEEREVVSREQSDKERQEQLEAIRRALKID
jgi:CBS domain containing-hemolysin-like protein